MTAYRPVLVRRQCKLKQNANEGCNSCATVVVIASFILLVIAPLGLHYNECLVQVLVVCAHA